MPFLTLEDPNAKLKGSRDPLGAQPIWGKFARHVVCNVTGAANSIRGFSILLLGRYYAARLIEGGQVPAEQALDVVLRMEQLGAYARYAGHSVERDIRGIERVKSMLEEHNGRPYIETGRRGRILSDQKVYGLWGLYTVSARTSDLLPEGPTGVSQAATQLIETNYRPRLEKVESELLRILARGGRLNTKGKSPLFEALCGLLPESLTSEESAFYAHHLRDASETDGSGRSGMQARFAALLKSHSDLNQRFTREEAVSIAEAADHIDPALAERLQRIIALEALLAPADALFDHVLTRDGQRPEQLAERLNEHWGPNVPNLDPRAFEELLPEIQSASSVVQTNAMRDCHAALAAGKYGEAIRAVVAWNADVMNGRNSGPWVRFAPSGTIDVRYRGAEALLPEEGELGSLWRNQYFVNSLKSITRQLDINS